MSILTTVIAALTLGNIPFETPLLPDTPIVLPALKEQRLPARTAPHTYRGGVAGWGTCVVLGDPLTQNFRLEAQLRDVRKFYIHIESELGQFQTKSFYLLNLNDPPKDVLRYPSSSAPASP